MIDTVVFDLGGVVVDWNPRYLYRKIFMDEGEMEKFLAHVTNGEWNERQDAGRPFGEAIEELSAREPGYRREIEAYFSRWPEMLAGLVPGTSELIERIATEKRVRLFALSNWSAETFPHALRKFDVLSKFEDVVLSGREKMIKPDQRFFKLLETRHGVVPSRALFIDDVEKNVNAAKSLGYNVLHFKSAEVLKRTLIDLGVLT